MRLRIRPIIIPLANTVTGSTRTARRAGTGIAISDVANDIRAGIAWLRARPEIDLARIAIVGHSEGGIIAPMIAATDASLAGIVIMAGTASPGRVILKLQQEYAVDSLARLTVAARDRRACSVGAVDVGAHEPFVHR